MTEPETIATLLQRVDELLRLIEPLQAAAEQLEADLETVRREEG